MEAKIYSHEIQTDCRGTVTWDCIEKNKFSIRIHIGEIKINSGLISEAWKQLAIRAKTLMRAIKVCYTDIKDFEVRATAFYTIELKDILPDKMEQHTVATSNDAKIFFRSEKISF